MSTSQVVLGIAAIVVASVTAFLNAHWQRKQMRQIEIYKRDPTAGLLPPPGPFWKFLKSYIDVPGGILAVIFLIREMFSHEPFTRSSALLIAVDVAYLYSLISFRVLWNEVGKLHTDHGELWSAVGKLARLHIKHLEDEPQNGPT